MKNTFLICAVSLGLIMTSCGSTTTEETETTTTDTTAVVAVEDTVTTVESVDGVTPTVEAPVN